MSSIYIHKKIKHALQELLNRYPLVQEIVDSIEKKQGTVLLVGGAVRDLLLGFEVKDLDIEIHGISLEKLESVMRAFGPISLVGKSFGVLRLHGLDVDWSLPRIDSAGRKPRVDIDPHMGFEEAFRRRDLTINAMGINLKTFELIDPFNGQEDLCNKLLRAPDKKLFLEDPLRFFRVMQFIGRFDMQPNESLNALCISMDISQVSVERIEQEFHKLFLKSARPSLGLRWLVSINRLCEILPELFATRGVPQNPAWHPEGDVFEHTMQAIDAAAAVAQKYDDTHKKLLFMYAALCHDLGKVTTTRKVDGVIKSHEHAQEGEKIAKCMLMRITRNKDLIDGVRVLVKCHMEPVQFIAGRAKLSAYKRLAKKLAPHATLDMLADLALADKRGRNPNSDKPLTTEQPEVEQFRKKAEKANVLEKVEQPVLQGRDLLDIVAPGPKMGELLHTAYEIQIEEGVTDKQELKRRVLSRVK